MITYIRNKYYSYQIKKYLKNTLNAIYNTRYMTDGVLLNSHGSKRRDVVVTCIDLFTIEKLEFEYIVYITFDEGQEKICQIYVDMWDDIYINGSWDKCLLLGLKQLQAKVISAYNLKLKMANEQKELKIKKLNDLFVGRCG